MYIITSGSSQIPKINVETGVIDWTNGTGISPYGNSLNANESEVWSANKGEHVGKVIEMPQRGDAHGLVWVHYDDRGESRVRRSRIYL